jgi:hypothetical protein
MQQLAYFAAMFVALGTAVSLPFCLYPQHRIEKKSVGLIKAGMTQKQVEAILGGPPGDYGPESVPTPSSGFSIPLPSQSMKSWVAGYFAISVVFEEDGTVAWVEESNRMVSDESWTDRISRWLGPR